VIVIIISVGIRWWLIDGRLRQIRLCRSYNPGALSPHITFGRLCQAKMLCPMIITISAGIRRRLIDRRLRDSRL
jgi:hypothetical protein